MDMIVQYEQEPSLSAMDTTPIASSLPVQAMPAFMPTLSASLQDLQHPNTLFSSEADMNFTLDASQTEQSTNGPMLLQMPSEMTMQMFLNSPMDAMEQSLLSSPPSDFASALRTVGDPFGLAENEYSPDARNLSASPPLSQVPSPGIHGASSSYGVGVQSSLDSALDSSVVVGGRSRANTSLSPPSLPPSHFASLSPPTHQQSVVDYPPNTSNGSQEVQPRTEIGKMLQDIAKTAIDAGTAFEHCRGVQQTNKVGELRDRINQVLTMLGEMSTSDRDLAPVQRSQGAPPLPLAPETLMPGVGGSVDSTLTDPFHLGASDQSRKRCASELEEHRTVKALKREPQDDAPLSIINEAPQHPSLPSYSNQPPINFPLMQPFSMGTASRPPSRPPTPPVTYSARNSFSLKQTAAASTTFNPSFANGGASLPPHSAVPQSLQASTVTSAFPHLHASWSDPVVPTRQHHHSLSAGSAASSLIGLPLSSASPLSNGSVPLGPPKNGLSQPLVVPSHSSTTAPHGTPRGSRSGSISGVMKNPYATLSYPEAASDSAWNKAKKPAGRQSSWYISSESAHASSSKTTNNHTASAPPTAHNSPSDDEDDDEDSDSDESSSGKVVTHQTSTDRSSASTAQDLPAEYRADVDRIFFEFLNKLCSNLDATCSKGEQIHQTLMAKKMQRLDESPDFRPFKFRILAFTNAFMEELSKQGYPEDKIPMKKVRNYLWRQPYILRFNEDGKKAKSKGNHIWNVEAKKAGDGQWEFRPFHRKLAGAAPGVAYSGLRWSWKPHVWDPQFSFKKIHVTYSSPNLPSWLSWRDGELSGTPPPDAESCQLIAIAKFVIDDQDVQLTHQFNLSVAPVSALDGPSYSRSRRPSFAGGEPPKRSASDSALATAISRSSARTRMDDSRVIRVLQSVAQRVTDEAESQFVATSPPKQGDLQDLVKQKHVLEQTVDAYDKAISGQGHLQSRRLAVAAQHVVLQAAQTVIADRSVATGAAPAPQVETGIQSVSMTELTDKTQDAIAMAVKMNGTASNEVDIIVTATSILKAQTPLMETPAGVLPLPPPPRIPIAGPSSAPRIVSTFPPPSTLSTLPEHV